MQSTVTSLQGDLKQLAARQPSQGDAPNVAELAKVLASMQTSLITVQTQVKDVLERTTSAREAELRRSRFVEVARISFPVGSSALTATTRRRLQEILGKYRDQDVYFQVTGYTDKSGDRRLNSVLSVNRAISVRDWLTEELGIPASRVVTTGHFESVNRFPENRIAIIRVAQ